MSTPADLTTQRLDEFRRARDIMLGELSKVVIGQRDVLELILAAIFVWLSPVDLSHLEAQRPTGSILVWHWVRLLTPFLNLYDFHAFDPAFDW